jgi:hypothetical protein
MWVRDQNTTEWSGKCIVKNNRIKFELSSEGDAHSVAIEDGPITFHTHPSGIQQRWQCVWAWPSGSDLRMAMSMHIRPSSMTAAHAVLTWDGAYVIYPSPKWVTLLQRANSKLDYNPLDVIQDHFTAFHSARCSKTNFIHGFWERGIRGFLNMVNTFTLNEALNGANTFHNDEPVQLTCKEIQSQPVCSMGHVDSDINNLMKCRPFHIEFFPLGFMQGDNTWVTPLQSPSDHVELIIRNPSKEIPSCRYIETPEIHIRKVWQEHFNIDDQVLAEYVRACKALSQGFL